MPWQLDQSFLAGCLVTVAVDLTGVEVPYVEHDAHRYVLRPVDLVAAAKTRRRPRTPDADTTTPFDPAGALLDRLTGRSPRHRPPEED